MRIQIRRRGVTTDRKPSILQHLEVKAGEKQPITHPVLAKLAGQSTILLADAGKANLNHFQRFTGLKKVSFLIPTPASKMKPPRHSTAQAWRWPAHDHYPDTEPEH
ncbi:hypothetical protein V7R84_03985 [Arachnia propionica]|uniref:hypothetical protein n=1 Tax=Arachnia propionica TaxID=1750 RepID=UPI0030D4F59F